MSRTVLNLYRLVAFKRNEERSKSRDKSNVLFAKEGNVEEIRLLYRLVIRRNAVIELFTKLMASSITLSYVHPSALFNIRVNFVLLKTLPIHVCARV